MENNPFNYRQSFAFQIKAHEKAGFLPPVSLECSQQNIT
jgi:hypothetical protein